MEISPGYFRRIAAEESRLYAERNRDKTQHLKENNLSNLEETVNHPNDGSPTKGSVPDAVNHPPHYNDDPSGVECIQVCEHRNFCIGNAMKYLWRAGLKGGTTKHVEDLRKSIWYIEREISRLEQQKS